jgi:hypothetical protein
VIPLYLTHPEVAGGRQKTGGHPPGLVHLNPPDQPSQSRLPFDTFGVDAGALRSPPDRAIRSTTESPCTEDHHRCARTFSSRPLILGHVPRRTEPNQTPLPFNDDPDAPADENAVTKQTENEPPRRGRPRVWTSEAERKRAYRERLAADHAEPERLRRELRVERERVADQDRQLARLRREVTRLRAERADVATHQADLEATMEELEARIEFWRSQASRLEKRLDDERQRARSAVSKPPPSRAKGPPELPDLHLQKDGIPPPPRPYRRKGS